MFLIRDHNFDSHNANERTLTAFLCLWYCCHLIITAWVIGKIQLILNVPIVKLCTQLQVSTINTSYLTLTPFANVLNGLHQLLSC